MRQVHREHQDVGDALVAFALEVVLGEPERVEAEAVHRLRDRLGRVEHADQLLVRIRRSLAGVVSCPRSGRSTWPAYTVVNLVIMLSSLGSFGELLPVCPNFAFFATKRRFRQRGSIEWNT